MPESFQLTAHNLIAFVPTTDPARAKQYYQGTLGLRLVHEELPFALVFDVQGIMLRVTVVKDLRPQPFTVLGWEVPDITAAARALNDRGVAFEHYPGLPQDDLGIWTAPGGAKVAWFKDPDGNNLSVSQH